MKNERLGLDQLFVGLERERQIGICHVVIGLESSWPDQLISVSAGTWRHVFALNA